MPPVLVISQTYQDGDATIDPAHIKVRNGKATDLTELYTFDYGVLWLPACTWHSIPILQNDNVITHYVLRGSQVPYAKDLNHRGTGFTGPSVRDISIRRSSHVAYHHVVYNSGKKVAEVFGNDKIETYDDDYSALLMTVRAIFEAWMNAEPPGGFQELPDPNIPPKPPARVTRSQSGNSGGSHGKNPRMDGGSDGGAPKSTGSGRGSRGRSQHKGQNQSKQLVESAGASETITGSSHANDLDSVDLYESISEDTSEDEELGPADESPSPDVCRVNSRLQHAVTGWLGKVSIADNRATKALMAALQLSPRGLCACNEETEIPMLDIGPKSIRRWASSPSIMQSSLGSHATPRTHDM